MQIALLENPEQNEDYGWGIIRKLMSLSETGLSASVNQRPLLHLKPLKVRRYFHKCFLDWYINNWNKFERPLTFVKRHDYWIEMGIRGLNPYVSFYVTNQDISIDVDINNIYTDSITWMNARAKRTKHGYYDDMTIKEYRTIYKTKELLWEEHIFESFMSWIHQHLLPMKWLALHVDENIIYTELLEQPDKKAIRNIPLWFDAH